MHVDFADFDHAPQVDQGLVLNLVSCKQLGVVAELITSVIWKCERGTGISCRKKGEKEPEFPYNKTVGLRLLG